MTCFIYGLRANHSTLYFYIGSTKHTPEQRFKKHISYLRAGYNKNMHFVHAVNKIGIDNVVVDTLAECSANERFKLEYEFINHLKAMGHPLTNLVIEYDDGTGHALSRDYYQEFRLRVDHVLLILNVYENGCERNGEQLHDLLSAEIEAACKQIIEHHFDEFYNHVITEILPDYEWEIEDDGQATGVRQRILEMLERHRSSTQGGL